MSTHSFYFTLSVRIYSKTSIVDRNYVDITPEEEEEALATDVKELGDTEMTSDEVDEDEDEKTQ